MEPSSDGCWMDIPPSLAVDDLHPRHVGDYSLPSPVEAGSHEYRQPTWKIDSSRNDVGGDTRMQAIRDVIAVSAVREDERGECIRSGLAVELRIAHHLGHTTSAGVTYSIL